MITNYNANNGVYIEGISKEDFKHIIKDMMEEVVKPIKVDLSAIKGTTIYTIKEAAERLGRHTSTVYRKCKSGEIIASKRGQSYIITHDNLMKHIGG
jgi:excisionase family DNA binding protein